MNSCRTLVLATCLVASGSVFSAQFDDIAVKLDQYVKKEVKQGLPGAALAVVINGDIRLLRGYGVVKNGSNKKVNSATVFPLASISKTFASAAVSILVERGLLEWDTHVVPYLENITFSDADLGKEVTLRHVLSQSTGLVAQAYSDLLEDNVSYPKILQILNRVKFVCEPGNCYSYQNVVYNLSADMLALAAGVDYPTFVKEQVFIPLRMDNASFGMEGYKQADNRASPHVKVKSGCGAVQPTPFYYRVPAAAGINASAQDLAKWMLAQMGQQPTVLEPSLLEIMHKPHVKANQYRYRARMSNVTYGLGWRLFDYRGLTGFVHHGGWVKGFRTEMVFNRNTQTGMVFLANCENNRVARDIVLFFLQLYQERYGVQLAGADTKK